MSRAFRRSFTHPLSNTIVFDKLDISLYLADLLIGGNNVNLLPVVMHEITHYWTFSSPVGTALSLLALESRSKLVGANVIDETAFNEICNSDLMYDFTMTLLQPMMEGMSEFAEFDVKPGSSQVVSMLSRITALLFLGRSQEKENLFDHLAGGLSKHRLTPAFFERKKTLFKSSFDFFQNKYLPGYLTLKAIHNNNQDKCDLLTDSDFFLMYFRSYIFDDWEFVRLILTPPEDPLDIPDVILPYLLNRVQSFHNLDHSTLAKKFEQDVLAHKDVRYTLNSKWLIGEILSVPVGEHTKDDEIQKLLDYRIEQIFTQFEGKPTLFPDFLKSLLSFRAIITLGSSKIKIEITKAGMLIFFNAQDQIMISLKAPDELIGIPAGLIDVDVIYIPQPEGIYVVLSRDKQVLTNFSLNRNVLDKNQMSRFISQNNMLGALEALDLATGNLYKNGRYLSLKTEIEDKSETLLQNFYVYNSLIYTPDELLGGAFESMAQKGIFSLLEDEDLLNDCVIATLISAGQLNANAEPITRFLRNTNLESTLQRLNEKITAALGFVNFRYDLSSGVVISYLF